MVKVHYTCRYRQSVREAQVTLNGAYYNRTTETDAICFNSTTSTYETCDFTTTGLNETARGQIEKATWYLGASDDGNSGPEHYKAD